MEEVPNVNNLNGVPNFGHGSEEINQTPEEVIVPEVLEEVEVTNQEEDEE